MRKPIIAAAALAAALAVALAGCSKEPEQGIFASANGEGTGGGGADAPAAAKPAVPGFDPTNAPVAPEPSGLGDFPYFSLIEGYEPLTKENFQGDPRIENARDAKFDRFEFFDGVKFIPVEGRLSTRYARGKGSSWFEIMRTYEKLIKDMGGVVVWQGTGQELADKKLAFAEPRHRGKWKMDKDEKGAVYMVRTPTREIWVEVWQPWDTENYALTVVERQAMALRAGLIPAAQLKSALDADGRVTIPVLFDTDKTDIKAESGPLIAEVVKLLQQNPSLKLRIEGHTDNQGAPAYNQALSEGRAKAVYMALLKAGIDAGRLQSQGFGQGKPVAPNADEAGRAKNRRVELVKL